MKEHTYVDEQTALLWRRREGRRSTEPKLSAYLVTASLLGPIVDCYDFTVFPFLAKEISVAMFDFRSEQTRMLLFWTVFGIGFIARVIGGFVFGRLGDVYGRVRVLRWALILISLGSIGLSILPSFQDIGVCAPIGLLFTRAIIGFAAANQTSQVSVLIMEYSGPEYADSYYRRSGCPLLCVLGSVMAGITVECLQRSLNSSAMSSFGWRMPFVLSSMMSIVAFLMQKDMHDGQDYTEQMSIMSELSETESVKSMSGVLMNNHKEFWLVLLSNGGESFAFFVLFSWIVDRVENEVPSNLIVVTIGLTLYVIGAGISTWMLDYIECDLKECRRFIIIVYLCECVSFSVGLLLYISSSNDPSNRSLYFWCLMLLSSLLLGIVTAPIFGFRNAMVRSADERSTVVVPAYATQLALFGGFAPLICQSVVHSSLGMPGVLIPFIGCILLSSFALSFWD